MTQKLMALWKDEEAPTAVEYALMVTLVAIAIIAGARLLGTNVNTTFNTAAGQMP